MEVKVLEHTPNPLKVHYLAARQCYMPGWVGEVPEVSKEEMTKLINKVMESGHTSTVEHVSFTFAIDGVSRALSHQLVRHRIASYSQQSQRYVQNEESGGYIIPSKIFKSEYMEAFDEHMLQIFEFYEEMVANGIPAEDARYILPNAMTTKIVVTMNCRSLINFFGERLCACAQWEIRRMAQKMMGACREIYPEVFKDIGPKCFQLGYCPEPPKRSCGLMRLKAVVLGG